MNSLEALKTILINCKDLLVDKNGKVVKLEDLIKTIKQDLERLEKLEEENKQLKTKLDRSLPKIVIRNTLDNVLPSLEEENEKLKQAIEILKNKIDFEDLGEMQSGNMYRGYFNDCLDDEEVNSIKEVFNNE